MVRCAGAWGIGWREAGERAQVHCGLTVRGPGWCAAGGGWKRWKAAVVQMKRNGTNWILNP